MDPDETKQNRCPRRHIFEDPEWWGSLITSYNSFEKGFLPAKGALDDQPALFEPTMATISSALHAEDEMEKDRQDRGKRTADASKAMAHGGNSKFARIPKPGKR